MIKSSRINAAIAMCGAEGQIYGIPNKVGEKFGRGLFDLQRERRNNLIPRFESMTYKTMGNLSREDFDAFSSACKDAIARVFNEQN